MKSHELVCITFEHNKTSYAAMVQKFSPTAIILPNHTVLVTTLAIPPNKFQPRRSSKLANHQFGRRIFDSSGNLLPLKILYSPGNWNKPNDIHFPIYFAEQL